MKTKATANIMFAMFMLVVIGILPVHTSFAATAKEIDVSVDVALDRFGREVNGAQEFLKAARGVLVIANVVQAGFNVGGEYGEGALNKFRNSDNWQAGVDGTVTLVNVGAEGSVDTTKINQPLVGFVFGQKGLMAGATIEASKITKLKK